MTRTRVVVCGLAAGVPVGGMGLHYLQYCLGLRDLGIDVCYLEDNWGYPYDPARGTMDDDASYAIGWVRELFDAFAIPWAFMDPTGRYHGASEAEAHGWCQGADLLLNVSGGHIPFAHHRRAKTLAYVDTDSGWGQVQASQGDEKVRALYAAHDLHFTFAESMGAPGCKIPTLGYDWRPTRQPVHLPFWAAEHPLGQAYTTIMNWDAYGSVEWEGEVWGQKAASFPIVMDLPARTGLPLEVALAGSAPYEEIRAAGWKVVDPFPVTRTIWDLRDYIRGSRGELAVLKDGFVRSRSGWFAERSANYLAAGRPVVVQDTGWSEHLPSGEGLLAFATTEEAARALAEVEADPARHAAAARRIAAEHFDARDVCERLLAEAGVD